MDDATLAKLGDEYIFKDEKTGHVVERRIFSMTDKDFQALKIACKPPNYANQDSAEIASLVNPSKMSQLFWKQLGEEMGFKYWTVRPVKGRSQQHFSAVVRTRQ